MTRPAETMDASGDNPPTAPLSRSQAVAFKRKDAKAQRRKGFEDVASRLGHHLWVNAIGSLPGATSQYQHGGLASLRLCVKSLATWLRFGHAAPGL